MQANSAEVGNEAKGGDSDAKNEMQGAQARSDSFQNEGCGNSFGRGRNFPRGRGRGGNPPCGGGHQVNFARRKLRKGRKAELRIFVKVREITQLIP